MEAVWGTSPMYDISVDDFQAAEGSQCMSLEVDYIRQSMTGTDPTKSTGE